MTDNQYNLEVLEEIKDKTSKFQIKSEDIKPLTETLKDWNECLTNDEKPKNKLIKIDNFELSWDEFKNLYDNRLLTNQYYLKNNSQFNKDLNKLEGNLDTLVPSMSKDGIFNMLTYNLAKHSTISDKVEIHYMTTAEKSPKNIFSTIKSNSEQLNNFIEKSKTDKKIHFILTDINSKTERIDSGHVTPYIIMNGKVFEFDSVSVYSIFGAENNEYSASMKQQMDKTSCKAIAVKEVDDFLKILEKYNDIEEFSKYLEQFFSGENNKVIHAEEDNHKTAIVPAPVLMHFQSLSSFIKVLNHIEGKLNDELNIDSKNLSDEEIRNEIKAKLEKLPEKERKKYEDWLEMVDKLKKITKKFTVTKKMLNIEEEEYEDKKVTIYTLRERLKQAKTLSILLEKGLTRSIFDIESYKNGDKNTPDVATVDKNLIENIKKEKEDLEKQKRKQTSDNVPDQNKGNYKKSAESIEQMKNRCIKDRKELINLINNSKDNLNEAEKEKIAKTSNSRKTLIGVYKYCIMPFLINKNKNPIVEIFKNITNGSKNYKNRATKVIINKKISEFLAKVPKDNLKKLAEILSIGEVRDKLNEFGKKSGINLGDFLFNGVSDRIKIEESASIYTLI